AVGMRAEMGLAAIALAEAATANLDEKKDDKAKDEKKDEKKDDKAKDEKKDDKAKDEKSKEESKLPEEFLGQLIKEVVMHEVGHSLGLRHNFKASTMLDAEQLNDVAITRVKGQSGSVMDYNPVNIAPKGQKQGDYTTTTIGPYDYWAIEYAYKPIDGDEVSELKKIAARSPEHDLVYSTDEDMMLNNDPLVNTYDLGSDTLKFAKERIVVASELLKDLDDKVVKDGESWSRVRSAFGFLLGQWGNAAYLAASQIGGQSVSRDHKGSKGEHDPIIPVKGTKQREALAFLSDSILSDKAFKFSPSLLRRLTTERWYHWGNESMFSSGRSTEYPVNERILSIQRIVLNQALAADVLLRLQNQELQTDPKGEPLRIAEVFRSLTDGIWSELAAAPAGDKAQELSLSIIRRNLQREYLRKLCTMVLGNRRSPYDDMFGFVMFYGNGAGGGTIPADARSLARLHLKELGDRLDAVLNRKDLTIDDTTKAHLDECRHKIAKVLDADIPANEP
ncbi:zinc-dependent metalloprotease, partial [Singulisphaera rosea]